MAFPTLIALLQDTAPADTSSSQNTVRIIAGVLALLLVIVIVMRRKGGKKKAQEDEF